MNQTITYNSPKGIVSSLMVCDNSTMPNGFFIMKKELEEWVPMFGYKDRFLITRSGKIRSIDRLVKGNYSNLYMAKGVSKTIQITKNGYCQVGIRTNKSRKVWYVHRLVALTFLPNPLSLPQINHIDGNKLNNHVSNLEWCNNSHNTKHAYRIGTHQRQNGEKAPGHKLTNNLIYAIRESYLINHKYGAIIKLANKYNVKVQTISKIVHNKNWKHLLKIEL